MKIDNREQPPEDVAYYQSWDGPGGHDIEDQLTPGHVQDIVEIFQHREQVGLLVASQLRSRVLT